MCNFDTLKDKIMNWQKANQALSSIERLFKVFEVSDDLSNIERDLLLRRIQDLYELVLDHDITNKVEVKTDVKAAITEAPQQVAPIVAKPPVIVETPKVEIPIPKPIEIPKVETPKVEIPTPKPIEIPKVETPKVEIPTSKPIEIPKVETPKVEIPTPKPIEIPKVETPKAVTVNNAAIQELFEFKIATDLSEKLSTAPILDLRVAMSINERFLTISELFKGNKARYDEAVEVLNNFNNFEQAQAYMIKTLIPELDWTNDKKLNLAKAFVAKVRRRYL